MKMLPAPTFPRHVLTPLAGRTCRYLLLPLPVAKGLSPKHNESMEGRGLLPGCSMCYSKTSDKFGHYKKNTMG